MYNITLIYLICLYKLNNGKFHIYFLIMIILGFITSLKMSSKMLNLPIFKKFLAKLKK